MFLLLLFIPVKLAIRTLLNDHSLCFWLIDIERLSVVTILEKSGAVEGLARRAVAIDTLMIEGKPWGVAHILLAVFHGLRRWG